MKLCTNCNRVLKDNDTHCRYCAGETGALPVQKPKNIKQPAAAKRRMAAQPVQQPATAIAQETGRISDVVKEKKREVFDIEKTNAFAPATGAVQTQASIEIPIGEQPAIREPDDAQTRSQLLEQTAPEPPAHAEQRYDEAVGPQGVTVEFPFQEKQQAITEQQFEAGTGVIERELIVKAMREPAAQPNKSINKLGVTLLVVFITVVLVCGGLLIYKLVQKSTVDQNLYSNILAGTWISDAFVYEADEQQKLVELLTINSDGTFKLQNLIPNEADPDGYLNGSWEVYSEYEGTYDILEDSQALMLVYYKDGVGYTFVRQIMRVDTNTLELREYYNEDLTEYADFILKRVS